MSASHRIPSRADVTRANLRAAGVRAISERGFHGTTTRDIAAAAGLSTAALYVHYRSKEELLYAISKDGHDEAVAIARAARAASDDPTTQLQAFMRPFAAFHAREHTEAVIITRELPSLSSDHFAEIRALRREIETTMEDILRAGVAQGDFHLGDPHMTMVALLSLGLDIARWYREAGEWTPERIADYYTELALRMVGAPSDP
ncbi:TetR/AcrR family transcriptional regulator [Microbacterium sp. RD1]|uniref:TetR/AcrR family transcriptional regulator n=1 Tax=Microbacterium sp. RD1 TaxID=3457313 RepID=UPI003FA59D65